ncbi:MAG: hypothetical protein JNG85_08380 [Spirochaetaceae bacterium]|nr:hypothetical protein [Spirochaetaceae bacterium]
MILTFKTQADLDLEKKREEITRIDARLKELDTEVPRVVEDMLAAQGAKAHARVQAIIDEKNALRAKAAPLRAETSPK